MDHLLMMLLLLLWTSRLQTKPNSEGSVRLVGGDSRCKGTLHVKREDWRPVGDSDWTLKEAAIVCRRLGCGSVVSVGLREESTVRSVWMIRPSCVRLGHTLTVCSSPASSSSVLDLSCSDFVRLVNGTSLCSGRLEVKSDQSDQRWSSVCEADFDQQDAEVVCRELGCGAPSVLQGALYGELEAPIWTKEFQCAGHESALLDCRSSTGNTCSPGKAVGLTCSEPVRLVGGNRRCAGTLELKLGDWRPVGDITSYWTLKTAAVVCKDLGCGSVVSVGLREESTVRSVWMIRPSCVRFGHTVSDCSSPASSSSVLDLSCSDSVRLVDGTSLCSGRLEVKSDQSDQRWSSVCEADFDQQDAEVVCRELGCGDPLVLQGALYKEVEAPIWTKEFHCGGQETSLLDCRSSGSTRDTCSPGKAVEITCSEPVRLVGGNSRCAGTLELKQGEWRPAIYSSWNLKDAAVACRDLDCGSVVSVGWRKESSDRSGWSINSYCVQSGSALRECLKPQSDSSILDLTCSDFVRLVDETSLCSGRLEVKSDQSDQRWSSVCEAHFDQQDAEVVCRELGCGDPLVLRGALYGEVEAPIWTKEFQCAGRESSLLDCRSSGSTRNTCSHGKAVELTCSEPVRLVRGNSRCAGTLEVKHLGDWKPVGYSSYDWTWKEAAVLCKDLGCGSLSVIRRKKSSYNSVWFISSGCIKSGSALRNCIRSGLSPSILALSCSDQLNHPKIYVSSSMDGVPKVQQQGFHVLWGSPFTISCSIQPQYPGGSFQLTFTSSNTEHNYTQPAVNHSAHFLFPAAEPVHQGSYSCVYHVSVFSHNFSSESQRLRLTGSVPIVPIIRWLIVPLTLLLVNTALYFCYKASMAQKPGRQENIDLVDMNLGVCAAEGGPPEEEGAQGAE